MTPAHTAGTASDGFRSEPEPCSYTPNTRLDYGERARCVCGCSRDEPGARHNERRAK